MAARIPPATAPTVLVGWLLTEAPVALEKLGGRCRRRAAIVDCLTLWVANLMAPPRRRRSAGAGVGLRVSRCLADRSDDRGNERVAWAYIPRLISPRYRDLLGRVNTCVVARPNARCFGFRRAVVLVDPMKELS